MNLYKGSNATLFSNTRNKPWEGWGRALRQFPISNFQLTTQNLQLKTLDLGCGNGRFLEFLMANYSNSEISYVGLDNSQELLDIAENTIHQYPSISNYKLLNIDINTQWSLTSNLEHSTFNLIVSFGVLHHLESFETRKYLIDKSIELLEVGGRLVITFWMFKENENFLAKHLVKDLGNNDYILSFSGEAERFCHYSDPAEIEKLIDNNRVEVIDRYKSDGFGNEMNEYIVIRKIRRQN